MATLIKREWIETQEGQDTDWSAGSFASAPAFFVPQDSLFFDAPPPVPVFIFAEETLALASRVAGGPSFLGFSRASSPHEDGLAFARCKSRGRYHLPAFDLSMVKSGKLLLISIDCKCDDSRKFCCFWVAYWHHLIVDDSTIPKMPLTTPKKRRYSPTHAEQICFSWIVVSQPQIIWNFCFDRETREVLL